MLITVGVVAVIVVGYLVTRKSVSTKVPRPVDVKFAADEVVAVLNERNAQE